VAEAELKVQEVVEAEAALGVGAFPVQYLLQ